MGRPWGCTTEQAQGFRRIIGGTSASTSCNKAAAVAAFQQHLSSSRHRGRQWTPSMTQTSFGDMPGGNSANDPGSTKQAESSRVSASGISAVCVWSTSSERVVNKWGASGGQVVKKW